jgi:predicted Zn-dependent protease
VEQFRQAVALDGDLAFVRENYGDALMDVHRADAAAEQYRAAAALNPHDPAVLLRLGNALLATGQLDAAIVSLRESLQLAPDSRPARQLLAAAQRQKQEQGRR